MIDGRTAVATSSQTNRADPDGEYIKSRPDNTSVDSDSVAPQLIAIQSPHGHMHAVLDSTVGSRTHPGQWVLNGQAARMLDAASIAPFHHGPSAHEQLQDRLQLEAAAKAENWDRPIRVGVAPGDAQLLMVPDGGVRHAEALGVVWDSVQGIH